jgi:hypothetical protein
LGAIAVGFDPHTMTHGRGTHGDEKGFVAVSVNE